MVPLWCPFCRRYEVLGDTCASCGSKPSAEDYDGAPTKPESKKRKGPENLEALSA